MQMASESLDSISRTISRIFNTPKWMEDHFSSCSTPIITLCNMKTSLPVADGEITNNVHIVTYQNIRYVYKFMWRQSYQESFEKEVERYIRLRECDGVLQLKAVVIRNGVVQGLLIPYIDGEDLWTAARTSEPELLSITYRIIGIAAGLENVGFYHEDLKCQNIV